MVLDHVTMSLLFEYYYIVIYNDIYILCIWLYLGVPWTIFVCLDAQPWPMIHETTGQVVSSGLWSAFLQECVHYIWLYKSRNYVYIYIHTLYYLYVYIYVYTCRYVHTRTHTHMTEYVYNVYIHVYTFNLTPTNTHSSPRRLPDRRKFLAVPGLFRSFH